MEATSEMKEVYFGEYCKTCIYKDLDEDEHPCDECLAEFMKEYSHKPVKYLAK